MNATHSLCFYLIVALLGLGSVGACLAASYTLVDDYLRFCLLTGLASTLLNIVCLTPICAMLFHSCVIYKKECPIDGYLNSDLREV